jgi:hypothetical protein
MRAFARGFFLIILITIVVLSGCKPAVTMPLAVDEYSLVGLWDKAVEITGVQEMSAQLGDFWLRVEADGSTRLQHFYFHGNDQKGYPKLYRIDTKPGGEMVWHADDAKSVPLTCDPRPVFEEIDRYGLAEISKGDDGYSLQIRWQWGSRHYSDENLAIFCLLDGELTPLAEVAFATDMPWAAIEVYPMYIVSQTMDEDGHVSKQSTAGRGEKSTMQVWFLFNDLNKAETVKHL